MGDLYAAYDPELDRMVAIKLVKQSSTDPRAGERLVHEAQVLARISHPHVVPVYEVGNVDGQIFVAMELVDGVTLDEWRAGLDGSVAARQSQVLDRFLSVGLGLQAAHDAGLVHRDFKPANVIVASDGRERVVDFGLAQRQGVSSENAPESRSRNDARLTATGSVVGTPRYMAPEQWRGLACDASSDQFSFCVALYEALFDVLPFPADTVDGLRAAVLGGRPPEIPRNTPIPASLRRALLRGLSLEPKDRFPSMGALLGALRRARGRHRRWVLVAAVLVPALFGGAYLLDRYETGVRQASARARLDVVDQRIERLLEDGNSNEADRAFTAFARMPENRGTPALVEAWLRQAARMEKRGDHPQEIAAYANAYSLAETTTVQGPALLGVARAFRRTRQWQRLGDTLDALERSGSELAASPAARRMRIEERIARLDLAGVAPSEEDVAPELLALRRTFSHATVASVQVDREDLDVASLPDRGTLVLHRMDKEHVAVRDPYTSDLAQEGRILFPRGAPDRTTPLGAAGSFAQLFVTQYGQYFALVGLPTCSAKTTSCEGETLYEWHASGVSEVIAAQGDVDRDGQPEVYVGYVGYEKRLLGIRRGSDSRWTAFDPHPPTNATASDVNGLAVADLDGDGELELVVVTGAWTAYDVRVLYAPADRGDGRLALAARLKLGVPSDVAIVPRADGKGSRIAISIQRFAKNLRVFSATEPYGVAPGVYILEYENRRLAIAERLLLDTDEASSRLVAGDFNADGRVDVAQEMAGEHATVLWLQTESGQFVEAWLESVRPLFAVPDPQGVASALAVMLYDQGRSRFAILGHGHDRVSRASAPALVRPVSEANVDRAILAPWRRAEELVAIGMNGAAANTLLELAQITDDETADVLRMRAASLYETEGAQLQARLTDPDRAANEPRWLESWAKAATLYEDLGSTARPTLLDRAANLYSRMHRFSDALRVLSRLATLTDSTSGRAQELEARLAELRNRVHPPRSAEFTFAEPLDPRWRLPMHGALRRRQGGLDVDLVTQEAPVVLAVFPVVYRGGPVSLAMDVDAVRAEWGARLLISLRSDDRPSELPLELRLQAWGGGGAYQMVAMCGGVGWSDQYLPLPSASVAAENARYHLAVAAEPGVPMLWCSGNSAYGAWRRRFTPYRDLELAPGPYRLEIASMGSPYNVGSRGEFVLRSLRIEGMESTTGAVADRQEASTALVEGDLEAALAQLDPRSPHDGWLRYQLLDELGAWAKADEALEGLLRSSGGRACALARPQLRRQLRLRPDRVTPLLRRVCAQSDYLAILWDAFAVVIHHHPDDPEVQRILVTQLGSLERFTPRRADAAAAAVELLYARAHAWRAKSSLHAARTDLLRAIELAERFQHSRTADAHRALAAVLALLGNEDAALQELRRALARSDTPEIIADMIVIDPALTSLREGRAKDVLQAALEGAGSAPSDAP